MVDLAVIKRHFLQLQGDARALRTINDPAFRGIIRDRDGYPLAISTAVFSIWANPKEIILDAKNLKSIASVLKLNSADLSKLISRNKTKGKEFVYLKREVSPDEAEKIKQLQIPGLYHLPSFKRYYPEGEVTSHLIGFTNVDDEGQEGLELIYNKVLSGTPGKKLVVKDRLGRVISDIQSIESQSPGHDLQLSINRRIQYLAYRELMQGIKENKAASGTAIVLDVKTGEVLAMVNQPSYNPNDVALVSKDRLRNRAITDSFEPGSTIKTFSVITALASGKFTPDSVIDTHPGWMRVDHHIVRDEHNNGKLTLTQILQLSSNVGISKVLFSLPPQSLWNMLAAFGFGEPTGIGFPGEQRGRLAHRKVWKAFDLATLSFGYGVSATALQLAHAYATIANGGIKIPLSLTKVEQLPKGERVIPEKLAQKIMVLMESVLGKEGTGFPARVPGYHVAGKTGTARKAIRHGYSNKEFVSSFIGLAPATNPQLVVAVVIHNPHGKHYFGGYVSGPVFEKIMEGSLRTLNIAPDDPDSLH